MTYFIAQKPTPILNTPRFKKVFGSKLLFDEHKLVRAVEMIALPGMTFEVIELKGDHILEVKTSSYVAPHLFIDERFGFLQEVLPPPEIKQLPSVEVILERMKRCVGLPYVWGGNYAAGIPEWKDYYPPLNPLSEFEEVHWCFKGVDCSGLLYEAASGCIPRNTSEQLKMGVEVSGNSLKPLDLIFYPGHVVALLNESKVIESRHEFGEVRITPLQERFKDFDGCTIKRFHPQIIASQRF